MKISYNSIGTIHTPFSEPSGTPIQPAAAQGVCGTVTVKPEYADGLHDLDGFSHIVLIYHLHKSAGFKLSVTPFLDTKPRGLFATRAPGRPNAIGVSVVRLTGVEGTTLSIENVDMLDGTPLLDIKPYVPEMDDHPADRIGWLEGARSRVDKTRADDRFAGSG